MKIDLGLTGDVSRVHYVFTALGVLAVILGRYMGMWYSCDPLDVEKLRAQHVEFSEPAEAVCMSINKGAVTFFDSTHHDRPVLFLISVVACVPMFILGILGFGRIWLRGFEKSAKKKELDEARKKEYEAINRRLALRKNQEKKK